MIYPLILLLHNITFPHIWRLSTLEEDLDGVHTKIKSVFAVLVPAGTHHNIINTGSAPMKLYTLYAPPNHYDGFVHHTCADAEKDNEHFDGKTTE